MTANGFSRTVVGRVPLTKKITTPSARVRANSPVSNIVPVSRLSSTAATANPDPAVVAGIMEMASAMLGPPCRNIVTALGAEETALLRTLLQRAARRLG
nr:hypothetical protein [Streptomyces sp. MMG1533]